MQISRNDCGFPPIRFLDSYLSQYQKLSLVPALTMVKLPQASGQFSGYGQGHVTK